MDHDTLQNRPQSHAEKISWTWVRLRFREHARRRRWKSVWRYANDNRSWLDRPKHVIPCQIEVCICFSESYQTRKMVSIPTRSIGSDTHIARIRSLPYADVNYLTWAMIW